MRPPHRPAPELRGRAFARRDVVDLVSRDQLAGSAYRRLTRGAWQVAPEDGAPVTYAERVAGFLAVLPPRTVLIGRSAAWAHGAWEAHPEEDVEVAVYPPGSVRRRDGLVPSGRALGDGDVVVRRRMRVTTFLRTAVDVARAPGAPIEVVPLLDAVLRRSGLGVEAVAASVAACPRAGGGPRARAALALADGRAESPRESVLRLVATTAGMAPPAVQFEVDVRALRAVGYPRGVRLDMAWPHRKVALEYDGRDAHDHRRHSRDLARHNALRALGWVVIQVDAEGLRHPEAFLAQLAAALG